MFLAWKCGIKIRINHSHMAEKPEGLKNKIYYGLRLYFGKLFSTDYFACGRDAGIYLFGKKSVDSGKVIILPNAIDYGRFKYDVEKREDIRNKNNVNESTVVIGHVGRFFKQKNHEFLIDIFNEILKKSDKYKLLLIGSGPLEEKIREKIKTYGIEKNIIMKKNITNVNEYMHASDLFVLPSLYEGLPVVGVEAQCADLPCIFSNEVTEEAKILETTNFLSIDNKEIWIEEILKQKNKERKSRISEMIEKGYKIEEATIKLEKIYNDLVNLEE